MMGMTSCDKSDPRCITKADAATTKNYLTEDEMKDLGLLVEQYLAFAESIAAQQPDVYKGRLREEERRASLAELEADLQAAAKKQS